MTTGTGADLLAFNQGDGVDTVNASSGQDNTLSVGGGIRYADLKFAKSGNNLELQTSATDKIILKDWYAATTNRSVLTLQMVVEASNDYNASASNAQLNKKVANFNFNTLVNTFDAARTATPTLTTWALSNALTTAFLTSSDTQVLGGDLAYQYGRFGNLANVGSEGAQTVLAASTFGSTQQTLQTNPALGAGTRLS